MGKGGGVVSFDVILCLRVVCNDGFLDIEGGAFACDVFPYGLYFRLDVNA